MIRSQDKNLRAKTRSAERKRRKKQEAEQRQKQYDLLTEEQKIARLIPGGSSRQRARMLIAGNSGV